VTTEITRDRVLDELRDLKKMRESIESEFVHAIMTAASAGISQRAIGEAAGLSHARIGQIVRQQTMGV